MKRLVLGCFLFTVACGGEPDLADSESPVLSIGVMRDSLNGDQVVPGSWAKYKYVARKNELEMEISTTVAPGHAYTIWFCGYNHPENCMHPGTGPLRLQTASCGVNDLLPHINGLNAGGFCHTGGGAVADAEGELEIEGFNDPDARSHPVVNVLSFGNTESAEITIVLRDHGPALTGADLEAQLTTWGGGCNVYPCRDDQWFHP